MGSRPRTRTLTGVGAIAQATSIAIQRAVREQVGGEPSTDEMRSIDLTHTEENSDATTTATFAVRARGRSVRVSHRFHGGAADAAAVSALVLHGLRGASDEPTRRTFVTRNGRVIQQSTFDPPDFSTTDEELAPLESSAAVRAVLGAPGSRVRVAFERMMQSGTVSFAGGVVALNDGTLNASVGEREAIPLGQGDADARIARIDHGSAPNSVGRLVLSPAEVSALRTALNQAPADRATVQQVTRNMLSMLGWQRHQRPLRVNVRHRTWTTVAPGANFGRAVVHHSIDLIGTVTDAETGRPTTFAVSHTLPHGSQDAAATGLAVAREVASHR